MVLDMEEAQTLMGIMESAISAMMKIVPHLRLLAQFRELLRRLNRVLVALLPGRLCSFLDLCLWHADNAPHKRVESLERRRLLICWLRFHESTMPHSRLRVNALISSVCRVPV